jgi:hypothetical protein
MTSHWFYRRGATEIGPASIEEMHDLIAGGRLTAADFIRRESGGEWVPAGACAAFAGMFSAAPPPFLPPAMPTTVTATKPIWPWIVTAGAGGFVVLLVLIVVMSIVAARSNAPPPAESVSSDPSDEFTQVAPIGPILEINGVDATPELILIVSRMTNEQKFAIGLYNATTGLDFYAARVRIYNGGDQPAFIAPKNIRLHLDGETVGAVPMSDARFLQPLTLLPGRYVEGLIVYLAYPEAGAAMRLGAGSISYVPGG